MRVLITGATGLIGREVGKALVLRGDNVVCLMRNPADAPKRLPFPAKVFAWDHSRPVPPEALSGVDAVINLAGEPVAEKRWSQEQKALIRDTRVLGTRQLTQAILAHGQNVKVFVQGSATGFYGERGDETVTSQSAKGAGFLSDVVAAWEGEATSIAGQRPDLRIPIVRTGVVLARQGGALAKMLPLFRARIAGRLGSGRQWMSWIHIGDIVGLFLHALDSSAHGVLEGVAPHPVTNREFTTQLCRAMNVFENLPAPRAAIKMIFGEMGSVVLESARVEPFATLASGYRFRFTTIENALGELLSSLRGSTREKVLEQWVPHPPEKVWPFFSDEKNLEELTPGFLSFKVLNKSTTHMAEGTLINYQLKLNGIPVDWQSRIENWEPPRRFVDTQVRGPYSYWHHAHEFVPMGGGTLMRDIVHYRLPLGWLGSLAAGWKVDSDVNAIFSFRSVKVAELFS